jgi:hypothetical protein
MRRYETGFRRRRSRYVAVTPSPSLNTPSDLTCVGVCEGTFSLMRTEYLFDQLRFKRERKKTKAKKCSQIVKYSPCSSLVKGQYMNQSRNGSLEPPSYYWSVIYDDKILVSILVCLLGCLIYNNNSSNCCICTFIVADALLKYLSTVLDKSAMNCTVTIKEGEGEWGRWWKQKGVTHSHTGWSSCCTSLLGGA